MIHLAIQETDVRADDNLRSVGGDMLGVVVAISNDDRTIDIKKRQDTAGFPDRVLPLGIVAFARRGQRDLQRRQGRLRRGLHGFWVAGLLMRPV